VALEGQLEALSDGVSADYVLDRVITAVDAAAETEPATRGAIA